MTIVRKYYRTEEINHWRFDNKKEAEEFIDEKLAKIGEGFGEDIIFTREEEK